jgi:two-component system sensor histidine kinase YesM
MLARMEGLLDDKFKLGREMKNLEVKALQAQINPHFLYNTLDLINWMSIRNNVPEISGLVEALGRFYKLSLSRGEDIVSIGNEIEHVKTYVKIQNMRFNNNINLEINFPEELLGYSIVKIVLQPIVENAILHGILEKDDEKGTIQIEGFLENNTIRINVKDDGIGMNDSRIREILSGESTLEPHGYGVHNINERLRLNYGNEYGLTFVSEEGKYTIATVRIPALILDAHSSSFKFDL